MPALKLLASTGVAALVGFVAAVETIPPPTSVWPTTVVGWITPVGIIVTVIAFLRNTHKQSVERAERDERERARVTAISTELNSFGRRVDEQMNGFGKRLEAVEEDAASDRSAVNGLLQSMAETRADRKHFGESLERIEASLAESRRERAESDRRLMEALARR